MTKHVSNENGLKFHLVVEEPKKLAEDNRLVVCDVQASPELESKLEVATIRTTVKPRKSELGKTISELYDLEACDEVDKPVRINLDLELYQMEKI